MSPGGLRSIALAGTEGAFCLAWRERKDVLQTIKAERLGLHDATGVKPEPMASHAAPANQFRHCSRFTSAKSSNSDEGRL